MEIKVTPEGRKDVWIPDKESLKEFIKSKKFKQIHNFMPSGNMMLGADHSVKSVLSDIDTAERIAIFTDHNANMGHSLAIIKNNRLGCYKLGNLNIEDLDIVK